MHDNNVSYSLTFGFLITSLAFSIGDVSGGHINPAITLAMAVTKNITVVQAIVYMIAQFVGGIVGGGLLLATVGEKLYKSGIGLALEPVQGMLAEFMGTFFLIFVVFNVALWSAGLEKTDVAGSVVSGLSPLPIGLTITLIHLAIGSMTGSGINPARVVGAVIFEKGFFEGSAGKALWIYLVGPFIASFLAPLTFYGMYPSELTKACSKEGKVVPAKNGNASAAEGGDRVTAFDE